jgi:hypothetical protein
MPALTVANALEGLLLREHFSPAGLELLFEAEWFSPKYVYPADVEIFRDIVLALLGRPAAPAPPVLPAIPLAGGFADAVSRAYLVASEDDDELHVPLDAAQALELLKHDPVRIGSIVVTMDGRWWESARFQRGLQNVIAYRPGERLRIDLSISPPSMPGSWCRGLMPRQAGLEQFISPSMSLCLAANGARAWEGRRPDLVAFRIFGHSDVFRNASSRQWASARFGAPSIEIAWSEVEQAPATGVSDSIDQLHRWDLIPLAHALKRLDDCLLRPRPYSRRDVEQCLRSVRYLQSAVASL